MVIGHVIRYKTQHRNKQIGEMSAKQKPKEIDDVLLSWQAVHSALETR